MPFEPKDRTILRDLAKEVAEAAARPVMAERKAMWKRHNGLQRIRPMILVFPEGSWRELLPRGVLQCEDEQARDMEWHLRLRLLSRSGRYTVGGSADYALLDRLQCPRRDNEGMETWSFGKGHVARVGTDMDWNSTEGVQVLLKLMEWLQVERPITATPGVLAALSRDVQGSLFATLFWPNEQPGAASFAIRKGLLDQSRRYRICNLFDGNAAPVSADGKSLEEGMALSFIAHELKVLRFSPE